MRTKTQALHLLNEAAKLSCYENKLKYFSRHKDVDIYQFKTMSIRTLNEHYGFDLFRGVQVIKMLNRVCVWFLYLGEVVRVTIWHKPTIR